MSQKNPLTRRNLIDALFQGVKKQINSADTLNKLEQQLKNAKDETILTNFFKELKLSTKQLQKHLEQKLTNDYNLETVISQICIMEQPVNLLETINDLITKEELIGKALILRIPGKGRDIKRQITNVRKDGHNIELKLEDFEEINYDITLVSNQQYFVTIKIRFQEEIQLLTWIGGICGEGQKKIVLEENRMIRVDQDSQNSLIEILPQGKYKVMMFFQKDKKLQKVIFISDSSKIHEFVMDPDTQKGVTIKSDWVEKHVSFQQFKNHVKTIQSITHNIQCESLQKSNNSFRIVKVQEDQKQLYRMKILEKINRSKTQITEQLKKKDLSLILKSLLGLLVTSNDFSKEKTKLKDIFIKKTFESIKDKLESIERCYMNLNKPTTVQLILRQILIETNYSLLISKIGAINTVRIMNLLAESERNNQSFRGKDIISFYGPTGSGKSTCVNYFMGVPLTEKKGRYGETIIQRNEEKFRESKCNTKPPQIGHKVGTSETICSQAYEFIKSQNKDLDKELRNVVLCDNPGFDDTRGTEYETCAGISFDTTIKNCSNIRSIVLVISFASFTTDRCNLVFRQLGNLEERFPDLLKEQTPTHKAFHILITKYESREQINTFQGRLERHIIEQIELIRIQQQSIQQIYPYYNGTNRLATYEILLKMFQNERIQFINLKNKVLKNNVLRSYLASGNIPKNCYKKFMESGRLKEHFFNHLSTSAHSWSTLLLYPFTTLIPQRIQQCKTRMLKLKQDIKCRQYQIFELNDLQKHSCEMIIKYEQLFKDLETLQIQQGNNRMSNLVYQSTRIKKIKKEKLSLIDEKNQNRHLQHRQFLEISNELRNNLERKNGNLRKKIQNLQTGTKRDEIFNYSHVLDQNMRINIGRPIEQVIKAWNGIQKLPDCPNKQQWIVGSSDRKLYVQPVISRKYQIVPNEDFDPKSYIQAYNKSQSYQYSNYKAIIESQHSKLVRIKTSDDGKKIIFYAQFYYKKCSKQSDLPYLRIIHQIPNEVVNRAEILNKQSELETGETQVKKLDEHIKSKRKQLTFIVKQRQMFRNVILQYQKELEGNHQNMMPNVPKKVLMEKEIQNKENIIEIISQCKKNNEELRQSISHQEEQEETYWVTYGRIAFLIKDQISKQIPQSLLKFVKQALDNLPKEQEQRDKMEQCTKDQIKNFQEFISLFEGKEASLQKDIERILQIKQVIGIGNGPKIDLKKGNDRDEKEKQGMVLKKEEEPAE